MTKQVAGLLLITGLSAFSQSAPDNAAARSLQRRLSSLTLTQRPRLLGILRAKPAPVCAIPLINVMPTGNYKMPIVKPPAPADASHGGIVQLPAPACDPELFRNK